MRHMTTALKLFAIPMVLVGIIYPIAITASAQLFFPKEAGRSLLYDCGGSLTGSAQIGQPSSDGCRFIRLIDDSFEDVLDGDVEDWLSNF